NLARTRFAPLAQRFLAAFARHRQRGIGNEVRGETFLQRVEYGGAHAHVEREAADPDAFDAVAAQLVGKAGRVEGGVLVLIEARALGDLDRVGRQAQVGVEGGACRILHAVRGPRTFAFLEAEVSGGMPVARGIHRHAGGPRGVDPAV